MPSRKYKSTTGNEPCTTCQSCSLGFTLEGCKDDSPGLCIGITCQSPPDIDYATTHVSNSGIFPSKVTYSCIPGYELSNSNVYSLQCAVDGTWSGISPKCIGVPCPSLSIEHGSVSPSGTIRHPSTAGICKCGHCLNLHSPRSNFKLLF